MNIYFSTVKRNSSHESGGELVHLDWSAKTVKARVNIKADRPTLFDTNYGGSSRGGRGILVMNDYVVVASFHSLIFFSLSLDKEIKRISHSKMAGIHEIELLDRNHILVTCTCLDLLLVINLHTGDLIDEYWLTEEQYVQDAFNITPIGVEKTNDLRSIAITPAIYEKDQLHLNAVAQFECGIAVLCPKQSSVIDITSKKVLIGHAKLKGAHNLVMLDKNTYLVNGTKSKEILLVDLRIGKLIRALDVSNFPIVKSNMVKNRFRQSLSRGLKKYGLSKKNPSNHSFLRGMAVVNDHIFVGISPATILCIDRKNFSLVDYYAYSEDVSLCIHGLFPDSNAKSQKDE